MRKRTCYSRTGTNNSRPENGHYSLNKCNGFEESIIVLTRHVVFLNFPSLNCRLKMFLYMGEITPCQMAISTLRTWQTSVTALTFTIHVLGAPIDFSFLSFFHYSKRLGGFSPFRSVFHDQAPKKKKKGIFYLFVKSKSPRMLLHAHTPPNDTHVVKSVWKRHFFFKKGKFSKQKKNPEL